MPGIKISKEIIAQNPQYAHLYDVVDFLENAPEGSLFPKKYEAAEISCALEEAHKLLKANPHLSLNATLSTVLLGCSNGLKGEVLLKITEKVIKKWEKLSKKNIPQEESQLQLA